jgi:hypothetical protein
MKTILKSGQRVEIFQSDISKLDFPIPLVANLEGTATLVKLVERHHTAARPYETWMVKFDDDEEPVRRDIHIKLPYMAGMSSSLARSIESRNLLTFMTCAGLSDDWADPNGHGVTAYIGGKILDNAVGGVELSGSRRINNEILIHLECPKSKIVVNLNTLLVLASSYIRQQMDVATEAVQDSKKNTDD